MEQSALGLHCLWSPVCPITENLYSEQKKQIKKNTVEPVSRGHCIKGSPVLSSHFFGVH